MMLFRSLRQRSARTLDRGLHGDADRDPLTGPDQADRIHRVGQRCSRVGAYKVDRRASSVAGHYDARQMAGGSADTSISAPSAGKVRDRPLRPLISRSSTILVCTTGRVDPRHSAAPGDRDVREVSELAAQRSYAPPRGLTAVTTITLPSWSRRMMARQSPMRRRHSPRLPLRLRTSPAGRGWIAATMRSRSLRGSFRRDFARRRARRPRPPRAVQAPGSDSARSSATSIASPRR